MNSICWLWNFSINILFDFIHRFDNLFYPIFLNSQPFQKELSHRTWSKGLISLDRHDKIFLLGDQALRLLHIWGLEEWLSIISFFTACCKKRTVQGVWDTSYRSAGWWSNCNQDCPRMGIHTGESKSSWNRVKVRGRRLRVKLAVIFFDDAKSQSEFGRALHDHPVNWWVPEPIINHFVPRYSKSHWHGLLPPWLKSLIVSEFANERQDENFRWHGGILSDIHIRDSMAHDSGTCARKQSQIFNLGQRWQV